MMRVGQRLLDPKHPLAQFSTGNSKTLKHAGQEALQHFFTTHYRPDNMQVAVADVRPMAELEREIGHAINKDKDGPVYLDELDSDRGNFKRDVPSDCGFTCEWKQNSIL